MNLVLAQPPFNYYLSFCVQLPTIKRPRHGELPNSLLMSNLNSFSGLYFATPNTCLSAWASHPYNKDTHHLWRPFHQSAMNIEKSHTRESNSFSIAQSQTKLPLVWSWFISKVFKGRTQMGFSPYIHPSIHSAPSFGCCTKKNIIGNQPIHQEATCTIWAWTMFRHSWWQTK